MSSLNEIKNFTFSQRWFVAVLLFCYSLMASAETTHTRKVELTRINGQIQQLQKKLKQDQEQQLDLQQQLKISEVNISQLSQQVNQFNTLLTHEQSQVSQLKTAQQKALKKLADQRSALAEQFHAAYQLGQAQSLKIILNHQDPNTLARHLTYYRYLSEARVDLITNIRDTLTSLTTNMRAINQHQQNLKNFLAQKQHQQTQQVQAHQQRQQLVSTLNQSVQSKQQQINVLIANQKALQQLVSQLQIKSVIQPTSPSFSRSSQKLPWPVKGSIAAGFGSPLDVGDQRLNGVIIKAKEGTPVHAISPGKIIFANWLRGFGLLVILNHGNGYMSLYARNHTLFAKVGDNVSAGDTIATTGSSGGFNKAGLYFEIRQNGTPINPSTWCR